MTDNNLKQIIHDMPKVELHLHLEGAFTFDFLFGQLQKYGDDSGIKTIDELKSRFVFSDFNHFIAPFCYVKIRSSFPATVP
jgi:adenosine deaminase